MKLPRPGDRLVLRFAPFTIVVRLESERQLGLYVASGDATGFEDRVPYELEAIGTNAARLSWVERAGTSVMHRLSLSDARTQTVVVKPDGSVRRLDGTIELVG